MEDALTHGGMRREGEQQQNSKRVARQKLNYSFTAESIGGSGGRDFFCQLPGRGQFVIFLRRPHY